MQLLNAGKYLLGWEQADSSPAADRCEKLTGLFAGIGLTITASAKDLLSRSNSAAADEYIIAMQSFLMNCQPVGNDHSRMLCNSSFPEAPNVGQVGKTNDILTWMTVGFEITILLLLVRAVVRNCTEKKEASGDVGSRRALLSWQTSEDESSGLVVVQGRDRINSLNNESSS